MTVRDSYDYIIAGAGSAGCVLANRLGEDPNLRILVLEAGGSEKAVIVDMPAALSIPMNTKRFNWGMKTEPEPGLDGREVNLPRGEGLAAHPRSTACAGCAATRWTMSCGRRSAPMAGAGPTCCPISSGSRMSRAAARCAALDGPVQVNRGLQTNPLYQVFVEAGVAGGLCPQPPT